MPSLSVADRELLGNGGLAANATAAANTAVVATFAALAGVTHRLTYLLASYSAAPTGGRVTVADGATTILDIDIIAGGPTSVPLPTGGIAGTVGNAMTVTLAAAGAAVVGKLTTQRISS